jgi:hypothetical protein
VGNRASVWVLANSGKKMDQRQNLERAAVFLLLNADKGPRDWGKKKVPAPALHDKQIETGIGITDPDGAEANQFYLALKGTTLYFSNPHPGKIACHELTAHGKKWAESLLAEAEAGRKPWVLDWRN